MIKIKKFSAHWCAPCSEYAPIYADVVRDLKIDSELIDVDKKPELWAKYKILWIPTTIIFDDNNKELERLTWIIKTDVLKEIINKYK